MPPSSVACPACFRVGTINQELPPGVKIRCKCGHSFVPAPAENVDEIAPAPNVFQSEYDSTSIVTSPPDEPQLPPAEEGQLTTEDLEEGTKEDRVGVEREATLTDLWQILAAIASKLDAPPPSVATEHQKEYKVITQKDKWFSGKFDPDKVEGAINGYAKQGWSLKGVATASMPGFGGPRDEIVLIMER